MAHDPSSVPVVSITGAELRYGQRILWSDFNLTIAPGEFVAVLGPNGAGKTSLLKVLLGQNSLSAGTAHINGRPVRAGRSRIGYIPQQKAIDDAIPLRGRDLVGLGVDGTKWGLGIAGSRRRSTIVNDAVAKVGATAFAHRPLGRMSGGEQQRLRVAQALACDPEILLCDEPLLSLDPANQQLVVRLINDRRRTATTPVVFVTHEINPILNYCDTVVYIVDGKFRIGPTRQVMTSSVLSELYGTHIDVVEVQDRLIVVGDDNPGEGHHEH